METMPITMLSGLRGLGCGSDCGCNKKQGLGSYGKVITLNTQPVINNVPGIDRDGYFNCSDWMMWHGKLVEAFKGGKFKSGIRYSDAQALKLANEVFTIWWNKQNLLSYTSICYAGNTDFRNWWKRSGLASQSLQEVGTSAYDFVTQTQKKVLDTAGNVVDSAGNIIENSADAASNLTKALKYVIPVTVVGVIGLVGYYLYKNYGKGNARVKVGTQTI